MNEQVEANGNPRGLKGEVDPVGEAQAGSGQWPTRAERLGVIKSYQTEALQRDDAHVASLELIDGDVMLLALRAREALERHLIGDAAAGEGRRFEHYAELYLRLTRQVERNARVIWQLSRPAKGEAGPG